MSKPNIDKYCELMEEIKRRMNVIDFFLLGAGHALYEPTTLESASLQLRKILELIAFGSLVANQDKYAKAYASFATHWHAGRMLRDLEKINPHFYPKPVIEIPLTGPGPKTKLIERNTDYLSKNDFIEAYDKCSEIAHAANPYGSRIEYPDYKAKLPLWRTRIINLLNSHQIQLVDQTGFYLIHMKEERDERVHFYEFQPVADLTP
ncbi:MAG TPA: hypothetical protein VKV79_04725 [Terriglobia bacterium]|nr:hypothetical protein [Terriglobia bacterium]